MVFSSPLFLFGFFPVFFILYYVCPDRFKNGLLLLSSILFYSWGAPKFVLLLLGSIGFNFFMSRQLEIYKVRIDKKRWILVLTICFNVALLGYFKYANFFIENINNLLSIFSLRNFSGLELVLPLGISFFTFHQISYIVDVYRGIKPPTNKISEYALYVLFFPQLICGPIIRYHDISEQLYDRSTTYTVDNFLLGFFRFSIGLSKKVLIANNAAVLANQYFNSPIENLSTLEAWAGLVFYTIQLYFDFSGYSDMAIGLTRMVGFSFKENFNFPYSATSVSDFWQRWHMSLGRWMKEYLYIPLGGNKGKSYQVYFNLWIVFLISGLWHGPSWSFILWGCYHGFFLCLDKWVYLKIEKRLPRVITIPLTLLIVMIGWVFFRLESLVSIRSYLLKLVSINSDSSFFLTAKNVSILLLVVLLLLVSSNKRVQEWYTNLLENTSLKTTWALSIFVGLLLFLTLSYASGSAENPFIYYRF